MDETWIETGRGRMMVGIWTPPDDATARSPIILFHDSLGSIALWRDFPAALAAATGRRVIAYDRLGFGRSDARDDVLSLDFVAEEAEIFFPLVRGGLGVGRFVAFGHSIGGGMAVHCAALHGSDCVALITESAQAFVEDKTLAGIREAKAQFQQADTFARLTRYHGDKARWVLDAWTETWLSPGFAAWSLKSVLPRLCCPTLALHGGGDEYGSDLHPETIAALAGGPSRFHILPGLRHVPHREHEALVVGAVADFLANLTD